MSNSKITIKGYKAILSKVKKANKAIGSNQTTLYGQPLAPTIIEIKKELRMLGHEIPHSFSHLYTLKLYESTKYKFNKTEKYDDGIIFHISFGYFVPYGLHLETQAPRTVTVDELEKWRDAKGIDPDINLVKLKRKLASDPDYFPIIQGTWDARQNEYVTAVFANVQKRWFNP